MAKDWPFYIGLLQMDPNILSLLLSVKVDWMDVRSMHDKNASQILEIFSIKKYETINPPILLNFSC